MSRILKIGSVLLLPLFLLIACLVVTGGGYDTATAETCDTPVTYMTPVDVKVEPSRNIKDPEQLENAKVVMGIGLARGFSRRDIKIAVTTALIESKLRNLRYGDADSLGIFQQRPSVQVWGTAEEILDPVHATNKFYDALSKIENRDERPEAKVAFLVQRPRSESDYTVAYSYWEVDARQLMAQLPDASKVDLTTSTVVLPMAGCGAYGADNPAMVAVQAALSQQNKPYTFNPNADKLLSDGGAGFTKWAWAKAGVTLPATAAGQYAFGKVIKEASASINPPSTRLKALQPGDLLYWESATGVGPKAPSYVAMYVGNGNMISSGLDLLQGSIKVQPILWADFAVTYVGATRPPLPNNYGNLSDGWRWPLKSITITSSFGMRFHPTEHRWMLHDGVDFQAALGTPVFAAHDGKVVLPFGTGFGNQVILDHGGGVVSGYAHLSKFAPGLTMGKMVKAGELIGYAGSTGWSTGPHLHFRILVNHVAVDPIIYLRQHGLVP